MGGVCKEGLAATMPDITIDSDAVQSARISMLVVRDTLNGQYAQHQSVAGQIEGMLHEAASSMFAALNPFDIWDRLGFGSASYSCSSIRGELEQARSTTDQVVERLCDTHRGQLVPILHDRAGALRDALNSALDSLWTITSLLNPGNILRMISDHGYILEHFNRSRSALYRACAQAQDFVDFLTRLHQREETIIDEIHKHSHSDNASFDWTISRNQSATPS